MKSLMTYQKIFNADLLGGISFYLINNPVISWSSGFIQGLTGLCLLIAILDAIGSIDNSREFARKMLTLSLCLLVVFANFGLINPRRIIDFNLGPQYDYMSAENLPSGKNTLLAKLDVDISSIKQVPTIDRDIYNALKQFFDSLSATLRNAVNVKVEPSGSIIPMPQNLQTFAYQEIMYLLGQAKWARTTCTPLNEGGYLKCVRDKMPLGNALDKSVACQGKPCGSKTAAKEADTGGSWYDVLAEAGLMVINLITFVQLVFTDFIFVIVFPVLVWALEAVRSMVTMFLIIGYGIGSAGMLVFAKLISPMLLLPKERKNVLGAYRTLYAITLFGFVTDLFTFFTSLLMMGLHYASYGVFKQLFNDAAKAGDSAYNIIQFTFTFYQLLLVVYFTILVILIVNIIALGKVKETCLTIANFSFSKLVSLGGELVSSGISASAKIAAVVAGAGVAGGVMAAKGGMGAMKGAASTLGPNSKLRRVGGAMSKGGQGLKNAGKKFSGLNKASEAWEGSKGQKIFANAKLGAQEGMFGDKGQKEMFTRNFADSILKNEDTPEQIKANEDKKNKASLNAEKNNKSGGNSGGTGDSSGGNGSNTTSVNNIRSESGSDNFDATSGENTSKNGLVSGAGNTVNEGRSNEDSGRNKLNKNNARKEFGNRFKKYSNRFQKVGNLVASGAGSGSVRMHENIAGNIESGVSSSFEKMDQKHSDKLANIYDNEELLESERNKLDMTDSGVARNQSNSLVSEMRGLDYSGDEAGRNSIDTQLSNADILDENGNLDESKINGDINNSVYSALGNYSPEDRNKMSSEAQDRLDLIEKSNSYQSHRNEKEKQIAKALKKYKSNPSLANSQKISNLYSDGTMNKGMQDTFMENSDYTKLRPQDILNNANSSNTEAELRNIVKNKESGDSALSEEANNRIQMMTDSIDLKDNNNMYIGNANKNLRELAVKAETLDSETSKFMASSEEFLKFNEENKAILTAFSDSVSDGELGNGISMKSTTDFVTGQDMIKLSNGSESIMESDGVIKVNNITNSDLRNRLTSLKERLDNMFDNPALIESVEPSKRDKLLKLKDKLDISS
jgi:hypothetical protein